MPIKSLATQSELHGLQDAVNVLAENLKAHASAPLGKAHGIQLVNGYVDDAGNDLTTYQDSHGDIVADKFVAFCVDGILYYAPGATSTLAGQVSSVQAIADSAGEVTGTLGGSTLITDYTSLEILHAQNVNSLFLEHTRLPHASAHQNMSAFLKTTLDSAGHTVGRYVVQLALGGTVYQVPCDRRLGGPVQPPRITSQPPDYSQGGSSISDAHRGPTWQGKVIAVGTLPIAYQWQVGTSPSNLVDLPPSEGGGVDVPSFPGGDDHTEGTFYDGNFAYANEDTYWMGASFISPGTFYFRCKLTGADGNIVYSRIIEVYIFQNP